MAIELEGGGGKALMARKFVEDLFCGFLKKMKVYNYKGGYIHRLVRLKI